MKDRGEKAQRTGYAGVDILCKYRKIHLLPIFQLFNLPVKSSGPGHAEFFLTTNFDLLSDCKSGLSTSSAF